jgi:hypothetical protein
MNILGKTGEYIAEYDRAPGQGYMLTIARASDARLKWLMESDCAVLSGLIHKNMQEILEYVWPPIPEAMPDEPAPMPEAMPAPRKPASDLARKLMASALASPSVEAMPHPCIMVKPARVPFAIAA